MSMKRIGFQRKMSMKLEEAGLGMLADASTHAKCRESKPRAVAGVSELQRDGVFRGRASRGLRLDSGGSDRAGVWAAGQEGAWADPRLCREGDGEESVANDAADPELPGYGKGGCKSLSAAQVRRPIHRSGRSAAGGSGPGSRTVERAGNALHSTARVEAVWPAVLRATGGDLGSAPVQSASQRGIPQTRGGVRADASPGGLDRGAAAARPARATPATASPCRPR